MAPKSYIFLVFLQFLSVFAFAQNKLPQDFRIYYTSKEGNIEKWIFCEIDTSGLSLEYYNNKGEQKYAGNIPDIKKLQELWRNLKNLKLFDIKIPEEKSKEN